VAGQPRRFEVKGEFSLQALKNAWHRWEKIAAKADNPVGRILLTALLIGLLYYFHEHWWSKLFIVLYMLTLGKFVFTVLGRVILTIIYALIMVPVGFFVRMSDPLRIRQKASTTFWITREAPDESLKGATRQG
jgi:predicted cation transporter